MRPGVCHKRLLVISRNDADLDVGRKLLEHDTTERLEGLLVDNRLKASLLGLEIFKSLRDFSDDNGNVNWRR